MSSSNTQSKLCQALFAAALSASAFGIGSSFATTYTWTPTAGGTYNWNNASSQNNWGTGAGGPFPTAAGDTANFSSAVLAGNQTINLNTSAVSVGTLNLFAASGGSLVLSAGTPNTGGLNTITFDNSGAGAELTVNGGSSISGTVNFNLNDNFTFNVPGTNTDLNGNLTANGFTYTKIGTGQQNIIGTMTNLGGLVGTAGNFFFRNFNTFNVGAQIKDQGGVMDIVTGKGGSYGAGSTYLPTIVFSAGTALGSTSFGVQGNYFPIANPLLFAGNQVFSNNGLSAVTYSGAVDLGGATRILANNNNNQYAASGAGVVYLLPTVFTGNITDGGLTTQNNSTVTLSGTNTYSGPTTLQQDQFGLANGTKLGTAASLSSNSNLVLDGGNLETNGSFYAGNTFNRTLGTGAGQFQWSGSSTGGGFAAYGTSATDTTGDLIVSIGSQTWGSGAPFLGNGQHLTFGASDANRMVTYTGNIALNGSNHFIDITQGMGIVPEVTISGNITNPSGSDILIFNSGLTNVEGAVIALSGSNNYAGTTQINGVGVRIASAGALSSANLKFSSGTLEGSSAFPSFIRSLGTGTSQVQWAGSGGFSASGSNFTVNLNNNASTLVWNSTASFVTTGNNLMFGSSKSDHTAIFVNPVDLNGATRDIYVNRGVGTLPEGQIAGGLINSTGTGSLFKDGAGTLELATTNTYNGTTTINGVTYLGAPNQGALQIDSVAALPTGGLILNGGVLQTKGSFYSGQNFTYGGTLTWTSGGFAAYGNGSADDLNVTSGLPDIAGNIVFGSPTANRTVKYTAAVANTTNALSIVVNGGSSTVAVPEAEFTNNITGGKGLTLVSGSTGMLVLDGTNSYSGATTLNTGWLRVNGSSALSSNSNLVLTNGGNAPVVGGVLEGSSSFTSFTRSLGSGAGAVQWNAGGFSASGTTGLTVNINNNASTLTWSSTSSFVGDFAKLAFGSPYANNTVLLQNPINLGTISTGLDNITPITPTVAREIYVFKGQGTAPEVDFQGGVTGGNANVSLLKTGPGTLRLSTAPATYTGATTVSAGTLLVNVTASTSSVTVNSGATLGGSGNITNGVTINSGGTLSPGNSPGQLSVGSLSMASGSNLFEEINGTVAGTSYDQTNMDGSSGTVSINGANLVLSVGFTPVSQSVYTIILNGSNTAVTGTFAGLPEGAHTSLTNPTQPDFVILYDYNSDSGSLANDVVLIAVPEPATLGLLGLSALAMLARRRKV